MSYRCLILLLFCLGTITGLSQPHRTTIAFGSCNNENLPQDMWPVIRNTNPQIWIWGGDNIYAKDYEDWDITRARYKKQKSDTGYQKLMKNTRITGTWDDHDYGVNDGGKYFSGKEISKKIFLDFIGFPSNNPIYHHAGVYNSTTIGTGRNKVKIINLDTRTFRDTIFKKCFTDSITHIKKCRHEANPTGDILGEEQWSWLTKELSDSIPKIFIINSSIQVIAEDHFFEKWSNLPLARKRLLDLIVRSGKKVIIVSGDRHMAELSKLSVPGLSYPLIDFTSSGITHTWPEHYNREEPNTHRLGKLIVKRTFGLVQIDWGVKKSKVTLQAKGVDGVSYLVYQFEL